MSTLLRPDLITIDRKNPGPLGPTGEAAPFTAQTVATAVPCLLDAVPVNSRMGGDFSLEIEGLASIQTHVLFADGLGLLNIPPNATAGQTITIGGLAYIVSGNLRGAFPDVRVGDDVTDQDGNFHLVLAVDYSYEVTPCLQARLQRGRSWKSAP
ncbi:MAG: hypothetical protein ACR2KS_10145 [Candidatus Eremiobacter antarcticus]|nr:hypothetical protein [Candidatus Eremiobacteraeota bacterium]MBC5808794.1 hypothetical protein [Candidatus Eremiobacteraeota bacterium]